MLKVKKDAYNSELVGNNLLPSLLLEAFRCGEIPTFIIV